MFDRHLDIPDKPAYCVEGDAALLEEAWDDIREEWEWDFAAHVVIEAGR